MEELQNLDISSVSDLANFEKALNCEIRHIPVKRAFDLFFSFLCLTLGLPIFILIGLSVFLSSRGSIIYFHERVGRGGKTFKCYKFRTMYQDADQRLKVLLSNDLKCKQEWESCFKLKNDPRITYIGSFLRKTSLDELPQFWNVLKGDLSVVGPRPVIKEEIKKYYGIKAYKILSIRPGLTGPWQVSGRSDCSYEDRIRLDESYLDNHSFSRDLKLIAKTIPAMLFSKGAY